MEKRFMSPKLMILLVLMVTLAVLAIQNMDFSLFANVEGRYYKYDTNYANFIDPRSWIELEDGEWTDDNGLFGRYEISKGKVIFYLTTYGGVGSHEVIIPGTVEDGCLTIEMYGKEYLYCLENTAKERAEKKSRELAAAKAQEEKRVMQEAAKILSFGKVNGGYEVTGLTYDEAENILIPSTYNAEPVIGIKKDAFRHCDNLKSVVISDSVKSIGDRAFEQCKNLTEVTIGKGVVMIGEEAFEDCQKLKSVTFGSLPEIGSYVFRGCDFLTEITYLGTKAEAKYIDRAVFFDSVKTIICEDGYVKDTEK